MTRVKIFLLAIALTCLFCGPGMTAESLHEKLNGKWTNEKLTVSFDWEAGQCTLVENGQEVTETLKLIKEFTHQDFGRVAVVLLGEDKVMTARFIDDDHISLIRKDKLTLELKRVAAE